MSTTDDTPEVNGTPEGADAETSAETEATESQGEAAAKPTLAEQRAAREAERTAKRSGNGGGLPRSVKRYGPFAVVAVLLVGAIAIFGSRDSGSDKKDQPGKAAVTDEDALIRSGPMTPAKAELLGKTVDFGPKCDTTTGRVKLPSVYAPPCVEPFKGDNGGATSPGVTKDEILVVRYDVDPSIDPTGAALIRATGVDTNPKTAFQTASDFAAVYNKTFELYGRKVKLVSFAGTGKSDDAERAKADAIAIADMHPFAVIGGPAQSVPTFSAELAHRGVVCMSPCAVALPNAAAEQNAPYVWQNGQTPDQAAALAAELIGNYAGPGKATLAGDSAIRAKDRKYALVHYNNAAGDHSAVADALISSLDQHGIKIDQDIEYLLDTSKITETGRTLVARLKSNGVTTVIFYGDPLMPKALTDQATQQGYHPEWILGPSLLADTAVFGRSFDQDQWKHGFGIGLTALSGKDDVAGAHIIYDWAYHKEPPNNAYQAIDPGVRATFAGIQMAGPRLTPEAFRDGMFRLPVSGGSAIRPKVSYGDQGIWPDGVDYGGADDASVIWWDPNAEGTDETGKFGKGMYRYADGGARYTLGHFPKTADEAGLFDNGKSLTIYKGDAPEKKFDYPAPNLK
jgi:hypothetical protein